MGRSDGAAAVNTIFSLVMRAAETWSRLPALRERQGGAWVDTTYGDLSRNVSAAGTALVSLGLDPGDRVGLFLNQGTAWLTADLAILGAGGVDVPRGSDFSLDELAFIATHAELSGLVTDLPPRTIDALLQAAPHIRYVVYAGKGSLDGREGIISWEQLLEKGGALLAEGDRSFAGRSATSSDTDLATIIYTSGTTGRPKGAMLSQRNIASNVTSILQKIPIHAEERFLCILPPYHMFERIIEYLGLTSGACLIFTDKSNFRSDIAREAPHIIAGVPRLWEMLYQGIIDKLKKHRMSRLMNYLMEESGKFVSARRHFRRKVSPWELCCGMSRYPFHLVADRLIYKAIRQGLGGHLRIAVSGGGSLPPHLDDFFETAGITLLNGYGLSETSPVLTVRSPHDNPRGTVGKPLPGTEISIRDEAGNDLPPCTPGIIWARGAQVMPGYYNDPESTEKVLRNGWFNTGDLGMVTAEGDLVIVGRAKDTIVLSGGENVEPEPIETTLLLSPYLSQVMVVGQDRKFLGALLVPNLQALREYGEKNAIDLPEGNELARHPAVIALLKEEVNRLHNRKETTRPYEKVIKFQVLAEEWTQASGLMTFTMKKKRPAIAAACKDLIAEMYAE